MSAIERRIADFVLDNAHLLRDYSSQQLADALKISQSSVVKFSQRLGFKGYPDLKVSISEEVAREAAGHAESASNSGGSKASPEAARSEALWRGKAEAGEETRMLNPPERVAAAASLLGSAGTIFLGGTALDGRLVESLAQRMALLGRRCIVHTDPLLLVASLSAAEGHDALVLVSELGEQPELLQACRDMHALGGCVISVTRHRSNPLRAQADVALLVSAHDAHPHVEEMLYQSALQHLLDVIVLGLFDIVPTAAARFGSNRARMRFSHSN